MCTLGFEDDSHISKIEIAQIQLVEAINLFLDSKYLCAITLAGAAEEVFARILNQRGYPSVAEESFQAIHKIRERKAFSMMNGKTKGDIFKEWNFARNTLKHHSSADNDIVKINLFDEAYWMIKRGISNANKLEILIKNQLDFENWIIININL